jgi:HSP20 family protein
MEGTFMNEITTRNPSRAPTRRDDIFADLFRDFLGIGDVDLTLQPPADVAETDGEITVKLEVPGVAKDDIKVSATDDSLTVSGETRKEIERKGKNVHRQEIRYGSFQRTMALPAEIDPSKTHAELANGVLTVTLPKTPHAKAKRIDVAVK